MPVAPVSLRQAHRSRRPFLGACLKRDLQKRGKRRGSPRDTFQVSWQAPDRPPEARRAFCLSEATATSADSALAANNALLFQLSHEKVAELHVACGPVQERALVALKPATALHV